MKTKSKKIKERLAAIEHQRWADWQKYLHSRGIVDKMGEGYLCIPMGLVKHWTRQIETDYKDLTEKEKDSDREQVDRYWPIVEQALKEERNKGREEILTLADELSEERKKVVSLSWNSQTPSNAQR